MTGAIGGPIAIGRMKNDMGGMATAGYCGRGPVETGHFCRYQFQHPGCPSVCIGACN
jgi:hypothetical protein